MSVNVDWENLVSQVETAEVEEARPKVEAPNAVVALLESIRKPSANGKKQRGRLPVSSLDEFQHVRKVLRAAADQLKPAASVTVKPQYKDGDEVRTQDEETGKVKVAPKEGAVPIGVYFSVGDRRGRKQPNDEAGEVAANEVEPQPDVVAGPDEQTLEYIPTKPSRARRK